jgi:hypothetical protein
MTMNRRLIEAFAVVVFVSTLISSQALAQCSWQTSGTSIMYTTCPNVGIGTSTANYKLDVQGNSVYLGAHGSGGDALVHVAAGSASNYSRINFGYWAGFDAGIWYLGRWADGSFRLSDVSSGSEAYRLYVSSAGNVGIGTAPNYKLDAQGNSFFLGPHNTGGDSVVWIGSGAGTNTARINFGYWAGFDSSTWNLGRWGSDGSFRLSDFSNGSEAPRVCVDLGGQVGIGTTAPSALLTVGAAGGTGNKMTVNGDVNVTGNIAAKYQDVAEWVPASEPMQAGTVVVVERGADNTVTPSTQAYDTRVAGVVSAQPGVVLGVSGSSKSLIATTGRVKVRVDASAGPIHAGDLLVTGDKTGMAMRSEPIEINGRKFHQPGTIIGKALESREQGQGEILVLLSLQ